LPFSESVNLKGNSGVPLQSKAPELSLVQSEISIHNPTIDTCLSFWQEKKNIEIKKKVNTLFMEQDYKHENIS